MKTSTASESRDRSIVSVKDGIEYWCQLSLSIMSVGMAAVIVCALVAAAIADVVR